VLERFVQDLKYSLRALRKQRAFTFAAVAALALGIGATTAVFSVVNAVLLRPFPYPDPDRIVLFMNTSLNGSGSAASPAKFSHWRRQDAVVHDASAFRDVIVNYTGGDTPEQLRSGNVSVSFLVEPSRTRRTGRMARTSLCSRTDGGRVASRPIRTSSARRFC
jgi:putative ABC transport system permease protein